jgi:hypothetical protein
MTGLGLGVFMAAQANIVKTRIRAKSARQPALSGTEPAQQVAGNDRFGTRGLHGSK